MVYKQFIPTIILILFFTSCNNETQRSTAQWVPSENIGFILDPLQKTQQPHVGDHGVTHRILDCASQPTNLNYEVQFSNPYNQNLTAVLAGAIDDSNAGQIFGFFTADLAPGENIILFDTAAVPQSDRHTIDGILIDDKNGAWYCSIHLLGFAEEDKFLIEAPITKRKLTVN